MGTVDITAVFPPLDPSNQDPAQGSGAPIRDLLDTHLPSIPTRRVTAKSESLERTRLHTNPTLLGKDLEENPRLSKPDLRNANPVFRSRVALWELNRERICPIGKRNENSVAPAPQGALRGRRKMVSFLAAIRILPAGVCLCLDYSAQIDSPF
jgi:hypothetical protein